MEKIDLGYATLHYQEPVVHIVFHDGAELGFPEVRQLTRCAEQLSGKKPYLVLSDARARVNVTYEGRKLAADVREAPLHRGSAILVWRSMYKVAINIFSDIRKPPYPFRAFTRKQEALDWLLQQPL
ncbi:MAG: hypothetical protein AB1458_13960 [Bacteroidota bacterium]